MSVIKRFQKQINRPSKYGVAPNSVAKPKIEEKEEIVIELPKVEIKEKKTVKKAKPIKVEENNEIQNNIENEDNEL